MRVFAVQSGRGQGLPAISPRNSPKLGHVIDMELDQSENPHAEAIQVRQLGIPGRPPHSPVSGASSSASSPSVRCGSSGVSEEGYASGVNQPVDMVVFDCDGVLLDSERLAVRVDAVVLASLGWELSEEEVVRRFVGRSHSYMVGEIEAHLGRALPIGWEEEVQPLYDHAFETELRPVEGVVQALDRLQFPTCVASSSSHARLRRTLGLTGLYDRFAGRIFSAEEVERGKPAPDLFLHAAAATGVDPARCVVVEDSQYGVAAARAAGMRSFGYAGGLTPAEWLAGPGTTVFSDMADLPELIDRAAREGVEGSARSALSTPAPRG